MNRSRSAGLFVLGLAALLALAGRAPAQYTRPVVNPYQQQQTLSPYLNLLRGGNLAANYYLGVRPDVQQRQLNAQFGTAIVDLERRSGERPDVPADELLPALPSTGHSAVFVNTGGYFPAASRGGTPNAPATRGRR